MNIEEMLKEMDKAIEDDNTEKFYRYSGIILESLRKRIGDGLLSAMVEAGPERVAIITRCKDCIKRNTPDCFMWFECSHCGAQWTGEGPEGFCVAGVHRDAAALKGDK